MTPLRVLIACESSGLVRDAFIARGHFAFSCDLKPTERPGPHFQCDVREVLADQWDMLIAHPVCTRLANSGVRWLKERPELLQDVIDAAEFFLMFDNLAHIPKRAVENPIMHRYARDCGIRRPDQYVHPHFFGELHL